MTNFFKKMFSRSSHSTGSEKNNPLHQENEVIINVLKENKDVDLFSLSGNINIGYVSSVYDGDTCKIVMMYGEYVHKWNCRVMGVDTPELRTKNDKEKDVDTLCETNCAMRFWIRLLLSNVWNLINIVNFWFYIHPYNDNMKIDKKTSYNQWLIDNNYAAEYYGGTKYDQNWDIKNMQKIKK